MRVLMPTGKDSKVREDYENKLRAHGFEPVIVRCSESRDETKERARREYETTNAVLLLGGNDVAPWRYNEHPGPHTKEVDDDRDNLDLTVLDWVYAEKKPVLGICRGAQMMAVHRGKKLIQHLPDYVPAESHSKELVPQTTASLTKNRILLAPGSLIGQIIGAPSVDVLCAHHQALLKDHSNHFYITAISPKGVPECWESSDYSHFCIGVQFHPETMSGPTDGIFKAFYEAALAWKA